MTIMVNAVGIMILEIQPDPNRDPNAKKSRRIQADTMDAPPSRKYAKAPESVAAQRFPARIVSSHAGGHWFESSSLHQKIPVTAALEQGDLVDVLDGDRQAAALGYAHLRGNVNVEIVPLRAMI